MSKDFFYSIIIPTYNRADELLKLLPSLDNQDFPKEKYEIIISDDGSQDSTKEVIIDFQNKMSVKIIYMPHENIGPGKSRNIGMEHSNGDYMIFIDSDTIIPKEWLREIDNALQNNKIDAFGGPDKSSDDFPDKVKAIDYSMTSFIGTGGMRGKKGKSLAKYFPRSFNMGISREVYEKIGGMSELRHGQDIEYSNRIHRAGFNVQFIPDAFVYHLRRTNFTKFFKQVFNWGVARINLWKIDNNMLEPLHTAPAIGVIFAVLSTLFIPISTLPFLTISFFSVLVLLIGLIQSYGRYHSVKVSILSIWALIIQINGYGLGFIYAFIRSIISKDKTIKGFTKNYYK